MKTEAPTIGHFFFALEKVMSSPPFKFHLEHYTAANDKRQLGVSPILNQKAHCFLSKKTDSLGNRIAATAIFRASPGRNRSIPSRSSRPRLQPLPRYTLRINPMYGRPTA